MLDGHTTNGKIAVICGIISLVTAILIVFNNIFSYISFISMLIAIFLGVSAENKGDNYGKYGIILGVLAIIIMILISAIIYFYIASTLR